MRPPDIASEDEESYLDEDGYEPEPEPPEEEITFAPRARHRLLTPWTAGLGVALVAALGFIGGVLVQKSQSDPSGSARSTGLPGATGRPGGQGNARGPGPGGGVGQARGAGQAPTTGQVKTKNGKVLYVTDASGNTVKVVLNGQSEVTRTAKSSTKKIHPGDTVTVQGAKAANGTIKATRVTATAAGASSGRGIQGLQIVPGG